MLCVVLIGYASSGSLAAVTLFGVLFMILLRVAALDVKPGVSGKFEVGVSIVNLVLVFLKPLGKSGLCSPGQADGASYQNAWNGACPDVIRSSEAHCFYVPWPVRAWLPSSVSLE